MFTKTVLVSLVLAAIGASAAPLDVETRSPETWAEWDKNIGNHYATKYDSPDDVPGLRHYKRHPSKIGDRASDFGNSFGDYYGHKWNRRTPEPESWAEWGKNVGDYWSHRYATPDDVPGLTHYKRVPGKKSGSGGGKGGGKGGGDQPGVPGGFPGGGSLGGTGGGETTIEEVD